jgi:hypothetical protein
VKYDNQQDLKRSLRTELLELSDQIQNISIRYRERKIDASIASEINSLQISVGELIGKLWLKE